VVRTRGNPEGSAAPAYSAPSSVRSHRQMYTDRVAITRALLPARIIARQANTQRGGSFPAQDQPPGMSEPIGRAWTQARAPLSRATGAPARLLVGGPENAEQQRRCSDPGWREAVAQTEAVIRINRSLTAPKRLGEASPFGRRQQAAVFRPSNCARVDERQTGPVAAIASADRDLPVHESTRLAARGASRTPPLPWFRHRLVWYPRVVPNPVNHCAR
jgi:hypothetical protein